MSKYKLIAFDMDGTLLNSRKQISEHTLEAINRAFDAGKEVILSTGRCVAELREYFKRIPGLRYVVCSSGAILYDVKEEKILYSNSISIELAEKILAESKKEDLMVHLLAIESIVQKKDIPQMERFGMGVYRPMYEKVTTQVDDIYEYYKEHPFEVPKLNLYHATAEGRERTRKRLAGLDLVLADAEKTALECSATGVTKGTGLLRLCEYLGVEPEETIAVGGRPEQGREALPRLRLRLLQPRQPAGPLGQPARGVRGLHQSHLTQPRIRRGLLQPRHHPAVYERHPQGLPRPLESRRTGNHRSLRGAETLRITG